MNRAVFLDRDGTIIKDMNYLSDPSKIELLSGVGEALLTLQQAGFKLIVITNQSGIARGFFTEAVLSQIHNRLRSILSSKYGVNIDAIYYSPDLPNSGSLTRKPSPELVKRACKKFDILPQRSFVVGDSKEDIQMGRRLGAITILLDATADETVNIYNKHLPHYVCKSLLSASRHILRRLRVETLFASKFGTCNV